MKDISQRALISHSFSTIFLRIPILGYFFIAGGLSYSFYSILKNKTNSSFKNMQDIGNMAFVATTSIGSSIVGGLLGQVLIPVPVLGALIGTAIGGFLGEKSGKGITKFY